MDGWLTTVSPTFATTDRLSAVTPEQKTAVAQSLSSTLGLDAAVLEDLLFASRSTLGDELLVHVIAAAHPDAPSPPSPPRDFHGVFETLHKFGLAWNGLGLDAAHLAFVLDRGPRLGWTDIAALPVAPQASRRLRAPGGGSPPRRRCRHRSSPLEQSLFGLLQAAADGVAATRARFVADDFLAQISEWTGWSLGDVTYLTGPSGFNFQLPAAMRDERPFVATAAAPSTLYPPHGRVGASRRTPWTVAELTFADTQSIKQALTLSVRAGPVADGAGRRSRTSYAPLKRDALLGYLLHTLGFEDSDGVLPPLPDRSATSRPAVAPRASSQAHAAVQTVRAAHPVQPGAVHFRAPKTRGVAVAQELPGLGSGAQGLPVSRELARARAARQQVGVLPASWKTASRRTTSPATPRSASIRDYLDKLDQVSRLEIMGMYEDTWGATGDEEIDVLHVFGRTRDVPHLYYYRRCEDEARWTPWEQVELDIQSDHLIPIVYNGRLYLFWPTFKLTPIEPDTADLQEQIDELTETIQEYDDTLMVLDDQIDDISEPIVEQTLIAHRALIEASARQRRRRQAGEAGSEEGDHRVHGGKRRRGDDGVEHVRERPLVGEAPLHQRRRSGRDRLPAERLLLHRLGVVGQYALSRVRGERIVENEIEPPDMDDVAGGVILSDDTTEPPATTTETLDLGYFYFDDCQSALVFVADTTSPCDRSTSAGCRRPGLEGCGRDSAERHSK